MCNKEQLVSAQCKIFNAKTYFLVCFDPCKHAPQGATHRRGRKTTGSLRRVEGVHPYSLTPVTLACTHSFTSKTSGFRFSRHPTNVHPAPAPAPRTLYTPAPLTGPPADYHVPPPHPWACNPPRSPLWHIWPSSASSDLRPSVGGPGSPNPLESLPACACTRPPPCPHFPPPRTSTTW